MDFTKLSQVYFHLDHKSFCGLGFNFK